ncbi:TMhelix containing protein [Vibrio phage 1.188.A._10N.286.51.A6]|uniref:TMhelix containing protein n=4 Tax=Mukerjeevirus TaxID=2733146 RepID=A0A2I7REM7_9CAUD|nr:TMhelix containing protein [Vibrio phage 1.169.O._10N.261.52.B1]YP_009817500.1 TMhelix containing protein [Vibrio phage 1.188.A._10N.286.51.A6]AUR93695.1 TMhelix containing protein [Vibrio phage 1.188.B._10N.286.51.A6]AUR93781.1 TMhelix containing protein [Vibrio phage 1.188.C._10N.286.51.A6]AUR92106.1 TMhelix containing protein [Vibrio phage 1.169.O._10N.261.52.B1]AUR93609.1 TMhelix containing protein [Vibrio phage 1.188.A._10N.286.51.A6]
MNRVRVKLGECVDILKNNGVNLIVLLLSGAVIYGTLSAEVKAMKAEQDRREPYLAKFIHLQGTVSHVQDEQFRNRRVWEKLDGTLNALNTTLSIQGVEIKALQSDVEEIKKAVVK